jgi:colanic acid/amylovoran biosynthesis glycosyltransferase
VAGVFERVSAADDHRPGLRVLFIVGEFPAISNPFILNQITGLTEMGQDVSIFALRVNRQQCEHAEVARYKLRDKVHAPQPLPASSWRRIGIVLRDGVSLLSKRPGALIALLFGRLPLSFRFFHQLNAAAAMPRTDFDIIHAQFGHLGNLAMRLRQAGVLRGGLVTQFRGFDVSLALRTEGGHVYNALFSRGDLFLPVCDYIRKKLITLGAPVEKTLVQYSGVDLDKFSYRKRDFQTNRRLKIGSIGRLSPKKGYEYVIEALGQLKSAGHEFHYQIVGDGELKHHLAAMIRNAGLERQVTLLGARNHDFIADFLRDIDIFISHNVVAASGDEEGIPNTIKEAMLAGAPVFSTYHAGIPEIISDGVNGFLTEERDVQQLVAKLKEYAFPLRDLGDITDRARERVAGMFDNHKLNAQLLSRYYAIL